MDYETFKKLVDRYSLRIGNRFRFDHLCSDHDFEIVGHSVYYGLVIYRHPSYCDYKRFDDEYGVYSVQGLADDIRYNSWYHAIQIDENRNDINKTQTIQ